MSTVHFPTLGASLYLFIHLNNITFQSIASMYPCMSVCFRSTSELMYVAMPGLIIVTSSTSAGKQRRGMFVRHFFKVVNHSEDNYCRPPTRRMMLTTAATPSADHGSRVCDS